MKISLTIIIAVIGLTHFAQAAELPEEAKRILDKLAQYEERELKATEMAVLKKKKDVLELLKQSEKLIESRGIRRLYAKQIKKIKREIIRSERAIGDGELQDIVDYDVIYYYDHPMKAFSDQKGELIFYSSCKAYMRHKGAKGRSVFEHEIAWELRDGELVINDHVHGDIIVRKKRGNKGKELSMQWTRLGKTITAKMK